MKTFTFNFNNIDVPRIWEEIAENEFAELEGNPPIPHEVTQRVSEVIVGIGRELVYWAGLLDAWEAGEVNLKDGQIQLIVADERAHLVDRRIWSEADSLCNCDECMPDLFKALRSDA